MNNKTFLRLISAIALLVSISCGQRGNAIENRSVEALRQDSVNPATSVKADNSLKKDTITFALTGDIMMGTVFPQKALPANDGRNLFDDVKEVLRGADIAAGNLEGTLFDGQAKNKPIGKNSYAFRTPAGYIENLTDAGYDFLGVANNHASDFGAKGRAETQKNLKKAGIAYAGMRDVCETAVLDRNGLKIGMTQFGHNRGTLNIMDYEELRRVVKNMKDSCDIVVVAFHGGAEGRKYTRVPHTMETAFGEKRGDVEKFAHTAIDAGADIVYGHGPHVPRAAELYKDRIIFYSLGNFCSPYCFSLTGVSGYAPVAEVKVNYAGKFVGGKIHSFIQKSGIGPRKDDTNAVAKFIRDLSKIDFPSSSLIIDDEGNISCEQGQ